MVDYVACFVPMAFAILISGDLLLGARTALLVKRGWLIAAYSRVFWCSLLGLLVFPVCAILEALKPETTRTERAILAALTGLVLCIGSGLVFVWIEQVRAVRDFDLRGDIETDLLENPEYRILFS